MKKQKITGKIVFYNQNDMCGTIKTKSNDFIEFHCKDIKYIQNYVKFNPGKNVPVIFETYKNRYKDLAINIEILGSKKVKKIKTTTTHPFRSNVIFERIINVYMEACRESTPPCGWDTYYQNYSFNPKNEFIHFPRITLQFFKSKELKNKYETEFNEKSNTPILPKTKKQLRNFFKKHLLKIINTKNINGTNSHSPYFQRLEEKYLETFNKSILVEFKLKEEGEIFIKKFLTQATSKSCALQKAFKNVGRLTDAEIINYRIVD